MSRIKMVYVIIFNLLLIIGCTPNNSITPPDTYFRIKQSIRKHDDNANGKPILRIQQNITIREISNFMYNGNNLLDSANVYDSTNTILIKSIKLHYNIIPNVVKADLYSAATGRSVANIHYNTQKQITKIIFDNPIPEFGFVFTYNNNKLSNISLSPIPLPVYQNFVYDINNNLLQFTTRDSAGTLYKSNFTYSSTKIPTVLDIRYASVGFQFLYLGGVNIIDMLGLNTGLGNTHQMLTRTDTRVSDNQVLAKYNFDYTINADNKYIGRTITYNDTIQVFYDYNY